ncbi:MAG: hypothetical protein M1832_006241 [Thelocarpon impressellum]|nr:MAG: hypothetical protein M1832_006241 [Thelocarpon impressellum]
MPQPHTRVLHSAPAARRAQLPERPLPVTSSTAPAKISVPPKTQPNPVKARAAQSSAQNQTPTSARVSPPHDQTQRPSPSALRKPSTDTAVVLSLVPLSVPGPIAATIVKELTTELSSSEEPGYIYIFRHEGTVAGGATVGMRILLKIGRSTNVQRRLKQWEQRCGRKLILMASFPAHTPSSPSSPSSPPVSSSPAARRGVAPKSPHSATDVRPDLIPYSHRVERLIHLELAPCRVSHTCDTCGSTHREWFEVRDGEAAAVMGAVRRWVRWAEGHREG